MAADEQDSPGGDEAKGTSPVLSGNTMIPAHEESPLLSPSGEEEQEGLINTPELDNGEEHFNETKGFWYMILLTISLAGLQLAWAVELSNGAPYILSLGLSKSIMALVWLAGPLSGALVQPYVGILSDNSRSRFGKRRPFMIAGASATIISLVILAWVKEIVGGILGLFGADFNVNDYKNNYPRSFKNRVITTINTNSIFGKSYDRFSGDKEDTSKYSTNWQLWGVDNWEFQEPRSCDTKRATDIRYLVLRSFGCLTGYIDKTSEVCNATNLFNDDKDNTGGKPYDDTEPTMPKCPVDKDAKFPFGHKEVKVIQPGKPGGSGTQKPLTQGTQPTKKPVSPTTSGVNSLFSVTCVLFSSMFMFATGFLL